MDFTEKTIATKEIYNGRILNFKIDTVELPNGEIAERELIEHPGGVGVVAVDEDMNVYMVEQFRKPYEKNLLEIPAGKLDKNENIETCGRRELEEEVGCVAEKFQYLGSCFPTVGYTNEITHLYLATGLEKTKQRLDDDEFLNVYKMPIKEVIDRIMNNEISDAKTVMGILKASIKLGILK